MEITETINDKEIAYDENGYFIDEERGEKVIGKDHKIIARGESVHVFPNGDYIYKLKKEEIAHLFINNKEKILKKGESFIY